MTSQGKAAKSKLRFPHLPPDSWKSHRDSHIPTLTTDNHQPTKPINLNRDEKCQPCARSKVSTIPPSAQSAAAAGLFGCQLRLDLALSELASRLEPRAEANLDKREVQPSLRDFTELFPQPAKASTYLSLSKEGIPRGHPRLAPRPQSFL
jgi:hypothetical protein